MCANKPVCLSVCRVGTDDSWRQPTSCVISLTSSSFSRSPQILCLSYGKTNSFSLHLSLLQEAFLGEANTNSKPFVLVMMCSHQNHFLVSLACVPVRLGVS